MDRFCWEMRRLSKTWEIRFTRKASLSFFTLLDAYEACKVFFSFLCLGFAQIFAQIVSLRVKDTQQYKFDSVKAPYKGKALTFG